MNPFDKNNFEIEFQTSIFILNLRKTTFIEQNRQGTFLRTLLTFYIYTLILKEILFTLIHDKYIVHFHIESYLTDDVFVSYRFSIINPYFFLICKLNQNQNYNFRTLFSFKTEHRFWDFLRVKFSFEYFTNRCFCNLKIFSYFRKIFHFSPSDKHEKQFKLFLIFTCSKIIFLLINWLLQIIIKLEHSLSLFISQQNQNPTNSTLFFQSF